MTNFDATRMTEAEKVAYRAGVGVGEANRSMNAFARAFGLGIALYGGYLLLILISWMLPTDEQMKARRERETAAGLSKQDAYIEWCTSRGGVASIETSWFSTTYTCRVPARGVSP